MAGWFSSKLKIAEQLLHQIDQQAAESLGKPERVVTQASSLQQHLDKGREDNARGSWTAAVGDSSLSATKHQPPLQRSLSGLRKPSPPPLHTRQIHPTAAARQDQDWTQLLGSPASSPGASTPYASSVGSCDPGSGRDFSRKSGHTSGHSSSLKAAPISSLKQIAAQSSRLRQPANARKSGSGAHAVGKKFRDESVKRRLDLEVSGEEQALESAGPEDAASGVGGGGLSWTAPDFGGRVGLGQEGSASPDAQQTTQQNGDGTPEGDETRGGSGGGQNVETSGREYIGQTSVARGALDRAINGVVDHALDAALSRSADGFRNYGLHQVVSRATAEDMNGFVDLELEPTTAQEVVPEFVDRHPQLTAKSVAEAAGSKEEEKQTAVEAVLALGEGVPLPYDGVGSDVESTSGSGSDDGSETSDSDYEDEVRRKAAAKRKLRKQRQLEALAIEAAKAAIREREAFVQTLEVEKEALERALADGVEQQVKEAAELQLSMMEVAQAVELEKQQHSSTRMEGLASEAQLEAENADLTRALAAAQRDLDENLSKVSGISSRLESKRDACSDLERKLASLHHRQRQRKLSKQIELASPDEIETSYREQQVELAWKIQQRQSEVKDLESRISSILESVKKSTDLEVELQGRLNQLTDQLIQKQAQVEALATEKATLVFRLEAITNNLREEKSAAMSRANKRNSKGVLLESDHEDVELGSLRAYSSKDKTGLHETAGRNRLPWISLFQQIDYLFLGGARILRRHGAVRAVAGTYLLALHGWFLFVLFMKSHRDDLSLPRPAE